MKGWTYDYKGECAVPYEAETFGYPHTTTTGDVQYENTHFRTEAEAWNKLFRELDAALGIGARERANVRARLDTITTQLADDAERLVRAQTTFQKRLRDGMESK